MPERPRVVALTGGLMESVPPSLDSLRQLADVVTVDSPDSLARELPQADILFVWDYRYANLGPLLVSAPNLRWIHVAAVGVDPVLSPELRAGTVQLTNSRGVFDGALAEYVAALLLAHVKDLPRTLALQERKEWRHRVTCRLAGQRGLIVGAGSIGTRIATSLRGLDVEVTLVGRRAREDPTFGQIRSSADLPALAMDADVMVLATPLTETTRGLVDAEVLAALGPQGYLVNIGRGPLVVEADLVRALESDAIAGAALDVFDQEPLPSTSPFWTLPNVVVSPHMSADYVGFEADLVAVFEDNLRRWVAHTNLLNVVDKALGFVPSV